MVSELIKRHPAYKVPKSAALTIHTYIHTYTVGNTYGFYSTNRLIYGMHDNINTENSAPTTGN
jgi:hypothetical protein